MAFAEVVVQKEIWVFIGSTPHLFVKMTDSLPDRLAFPLGSVLRLFMKPEFLAGLESA